MEDKQMGAERPTGCSGERECTERNKDLTALPDIKKGGNPTMEDIP
jgi:hypothetical protein